MRLWHSNSKSIHCTNL